MSLAIGSAGTLTLLGSGGGGGTPAPPSPDERFISRRDGGSNGNDYYAAIGATNDTFSLFRQRNGFNAPPPQNGPNPEAAAQYFNAGDLNLGRDMHCLPQPGRLACYVSNYTALDAEGLPIFSDDPTAAFEAMHSIGPFATVAMEYVAPTTLGPTALVVRECDGKPTGSVPVGTCGLEERPPVNVGEIRDPATGLDVDTGIDLQLGDTLQISASGTIDVGFIPFGARTGPNGESAVSSDPKFPLHPGNPFALIGRVGDAGYFFVGQTLDTTYTGAPGRLFLRSNDDTPGNGWGHFDVTVTVRRASSAKFYVYLGDGSIAPAAILDSQGPKQVPGVCLACHGGKYDSVSHTVTGASFLPFNTKSFKYDSRPGLDRASQEEGFRRLNALVRSTRDTAPERFDPIAQYIDGMYSPSGVNTAGAVSRDDFVPPGWASLPNVYLGVIRPYCTGCHLALGPGPNLDLTDASHLTGPRQSLVNALMCTSHVMPHSEVTFRHFWTDDLGAWPNYVASPSTLGLSSCAR